MTSGGEQQSQAPKRRVRASTKERKILEGGNGKGDDPAAAEAVQLGSKKTREDLKREAEEADHKRNQAFRNHFEVVAVVTLWILFAGLVLLAVTWLIHVLAPTGTKLDVGCFSLGGWLKPSDFERVQGILTGGVIAGLVADHFKRRIG